MTEYELWAFDVDGTLVKNGSCWFELHIHFDVLDKVAPNMEAFKAGKIDYTEFMKRDTECWNGRGKSGGMPHREELEEVLVGKIEYNPGVKELFDELHKNGKKIVLLSAGLDIRVNAVAEELGVPLENVLCNSLAFDEDGFVKYPAEPTDDLPLGMKAKALEDFCKKFNVPIEKTIAFEDSKYGIDLMDKAAYAVGVIPKGKDEVDPILKEHVDVVIRDFKEVIKYI